MQSTTTTTIKLVVIGASGVGKTSIRNQYISGRFSTNYRATIGADFITKTLAHPTIPDQSVALQIWDTAGQERFSSLSSAFFRGADAVMLMFDVNDLRTLHALTTWWNEFKEHAPLDDADVEDYCCMVVGNKVDLIEEGKEQPVSEADALQFLEELIPVSSSSPRQPPSPRRVLYVDDDNEVIEGDDLSASQRTEVPPIPPRTPSSSPPPSPPPRPVHGSHSIAISKSPTPSRHLSRSVGNGTIGTGRTTLSIYHTPSSSLFDQFHSARGSPEPSSHSHTHSQSPPSSPSPQSHLSPRARMPSLSSSSSGMTITPSLFAQTRVNESNSGSSTTTTVPAAGPRDRGPRLFFTSARTGLGVQDVFEYAAKRVVRRWDEEERVMHVMEGSAEDSVRLAVEEARGRGTRRRRGRKCCN